MTSWYGLGSAMLILYAGTGCAAPAPSNTPDTNFAQHGLCAELERGALSLGTSCRTLINATSPANETGVLIKEGERYRVSVATGHIWKDASTASDPLLGSKGTNLMNMLASWKRSPKSDWFVLIAEVSCRKEQIDLSQSQEFNTVHGGQLILYANDVPLFYWNNSGVIEVLITHLRDKLE